MSGDEERSKRNYIFFRNSDVRLLTQPAAIKQCHLAFSTSSRQRVSSATSVPYTPHPTTTFFYDYLKYFRSIPCMCVACNIKHPRWWSSQGGYMDGFRCVIASSGGYEWKRVSLSMVLMG